MNAIAYTAALQNHGRRPILWAAFGLYTAILIYAMTRHELWGDELQAWNLAKASASPGSLLHNTRFEGHPPAWFILLWFVSTFTHNPAWIQALQVVICCGAVFLVLFYSPLPLVTRLLLPFGYFFLFEYAVLSRNYMIAVLPAFGICLLMGSHYRYKIPLYYVLLLLVTAAHLLALPLAAGLQGYFLFRLAEQRPKKTTIALHAGLGILAALPAMYFIFPPSDSQINLSFWISRWSAHQLTAFIQAPLQAFMPVPAWWKDQFWNTQVFVEAKNNYHAFRLLNWPISLATIALALYVLRANRKCLVLFATAFLLSLLIAITIFPLSGARYTGFLFIAFMAAYWLYCYEASPSRGSRWLVNGMLAIQLAAGVFIVVKDTRLPFSNLYKVNELLNEVPAGERTVCDYWALNAVSAFAGRPLYCVDLQKQASFILWGSDMAAMQKRPYRYRDGVRYLFQQENIKSVYLVSTGSLPNINRLDSLFLSSFHVELVDKREGAIEKGSNLYLYHIKEE